MALELDSENEKKYRGATNSNSSSEDVDMVMVESVITTNFNDYTSEYSRWLA